MANKNNKNYAWFKYSLKKNDSGLSDQKYKPIHNFPERNNFETVFFQLGTTTITGYYLGLQKNAFSFSQVAKNFINRDWNFISGLSAQYILFILEENEAKLTVISDNTGSFPIYFSKVDNTIYFSPNIDFFTEILDSLTINVFTTLNMVCHLDAFEEETLFTEVSRIPPSCFFTIENGKEIGINSYLKELIYSNNKQTVKKFPDFESFKKSFLYTLEEVVSDYLFAIGDKNYISDLSAGFDSSLISYMLNRLNPKKTQCLYVDLPEPFGTQDKHCIHQFAKKHSLKYDVLINNYEELEKTAFYISQYPASYNNYSMDLRLRYMFEKHQAKINFTGHGGDELFGAPPIRERFLIKPYALHSLTLKKTLTTVVDVFSQKGISTISNSEKFEKAMYYPTLVSDSVISNNQKRFPEYWKNNACMLSPLTDPRMIAICQKAPTKKDGKPMFQKDFWATVGPEIHTQRHFSKNKIDEFGSQLEELIRVNTDQIISHLKQSPLAQTGLFKFDFFITQLTSSELYKQKIDMSNLYWIFIIRLSSYIRYLSQNKQVKIKI
ncbi:hypothetical protein KA017_02565 [Candidatus Woesebacteria bacterium]|nr:hypothetical protein [Candidatus Woesebacteria bacterium]